ncbi:MAG: ABC transporter ATP-binding protein [Myxococcales bacterium]|nr:ABC transporter ATP-binding protein [Myxococcales bacterium]
MAFQHKNEQNERPGTRGASLDSGVLLRAAEIALGGLRGTPAPDLTRFVAPSVHGLAGVAAMLEGAADVVARTCRVRPGDLADLSGQAAALASVDDGWLVVGSRGAIEVTPRGERTVRGGPKGLVSRLGAGPVEAVVVEPRLGLASLSAGESDASGPWFRLRSLVALEGPELWAIVAYAVVVGGLSLAVPIAVQVLVNTIAFGSLLQPLVVLAILLFGVLSFSGLVQVIQWYAVELLQRRIFVRVAEDLARRLATVSFGVRDTVDVRDLTNRFFEVVNLQKSARHLAIDGLGLVLQAIVGLLLLAFYHPVLLAFDAVLLLGLILVLRLGRGAVKTAVLESKAKYGVAGWLETIAASPMLFKREDAAFFFLMQADALVRNWVGARRRHYRYAFRQLVGGIGVQIVAMVALLGLGGWLVMKGELTLGQLVAAELVVGVVGAGFAKLGKHLETSYDLLAGLDKLGRILDLPGDLPRGERVDGGGELGVELRDVHLSKGGRSLGRVDGRIPPRARVLVGGAGGTGKSALLELLAGLRVPDSGSVRVGELECPAGFRPPLRDRSFLVRPRDLIEASVLDNLRLARADLDEEGAWAVLRTLHLDGVVSKFRAGLATPVLSDGTPFSSSELARLALARALLVSPDLLLVDRALDDLGLGSAERAEVLDLFLGAEAPWAAVVVSAEPNVQKRCQTTMSVDQGGAS